MLSLLLNVHIVGGAKDLVEHLEGATMRPKVVECLIEDLRMSGYPGYEANGLNSRERVQQRMKELYEIPYNRRDKFVPQ